MASVQSTCATFVNLMVTETGVHTLAFGGRPLKRPTQLIGGVRGAQNIEWNQLGDLTRGCLQAFEKENKLFITATVRRPASETQRERTSSLWHFHWS
jgi:hypothetical protein